MNDATFTTLLSVLIPSVPSRITKMQALFAKLQAQIGDLPVEVLCLLDNKKRTVGMKRDALVRTATGIYLAFVDDDDNVADDYIAKIVAKIREVTQQPPHLWPEVIVFKQRCTFTNAKCISCLEIDGPPFEIDHDINADMQAVHQYPDGTWKDITRKPWHHNAWRADIAQSEHFPDTNFGEDGGWVSKLWPKITRQARIEGPPLHYYQFNGKTTEAS
jgi:hypothetical protein